MATEKTCNAINRTTEQNKKFHAMLRDIAKQVKWAGELIDEEDFKRLMLAAKYGQRIVPNPLGYPGFIVMNVRRSKQLSIEEMSDFIAEIECFGAEQNVKWTDEE